MSHLSPDELVDAIEHRLSAARQPHLHECAECRGQVVKMTALLDELQTVEVPEPSPLFWEHLANRVRTAVGTQPAVPTKAARWFQWPVLVPIAGLAVLVLALASVVPQTATDDVPSDVAMTDSDPSPSSDADDAHWEMMAALVGEVDFDEASEAGVRTSPGTADEAVWQLSLSEQQELLRLLREELEHSGG